MGDVNPGEGGRSDEPADTDRVGGTASADRIGGTDAVVVGSGPNGLAAAITLARAGRSVVVLEAGDRPGGAARSGELTVPGLVHDLGSAVHPLARASPFFSSLDLERHGLHWITPEVAAAHPLDGGRAGIAWVDLERTVADLGADGEAYRRLYQRYVDGFADLCDLALHPPVRVPRRPAFAAGFGLRAAVPATVLARRFCTEEGRGLLAGHAAHAGRPLSKPLTSAFGLLFGASAHAVGWPFPAGGAQSLVDALVAELESLGGEVRCGRPVRHLGDLPPHRAVVFALVAEQVADIGADALGERYQRRLRRLGRGSAALKVDYALRGPVPWAHPDVGRAATVHVAGTLEDVATSERAVAGGHHAERPFALVAQPTAFDPSRSADGHHVVWAYCHVPNGSARDVSDRIDAQIERFAPGFGDLVVARHVTRPPDLEARNPNLPGGDIGGGSMAGTRALFRPMVRRNPFTTDDAAIFIGSASTTPGAGVHGMAGHQAALAALAGPLA